jgi:transposase
LQQDNAPPHKGQTLQYLEKNKIATLHWPAKSPDLNPIEQVWLWMATKLKQVKINTIEELRAKVYSLWEEIPKETILNYVNKVQDKAYWVRNQKGALYPD